MCRRRTAYESPPVGSEKGVIVFAPLSHAGMPSKVRGSAGDNQNYCDVEGQGENLPIQTANTDDVNQEY